MLELRTSENAAEWLYFTNYAYRDMISIPAVTMRVEFPWSRMEVLMFFADAEQSSEVPELLLELEGITRRANEAGCRAEVVTQDFRPGQVGVVSEKLARSANRRIRERLATGHAQRAADGFLRGHMQAALAHARMAFGLRDDLSPGPLTNVGYILMLAGDPEQAREAFLSAADPGNSSKVENRVTIPALPLYDLATLCIQAGEFGQALVYLDKSIEAIKASGAEKVMCQSLLVPQRDAGGIRTYEFREVPDLVSIAGKARETLCLYPDALGTV